MRWVAVGAFVVLAAVACSNDDTSQARALLEMLLDQDEIVNDRDFEQGGVWDVTLTYDELVQRIPNDWEVVSEGEYRIPDLFSEGEYCSVFFSEDTLPELLIECGIR